MHHRTPDKAYEHGIVCRCLEEAKDFLSFQERTIHSAMSRQEFIKLVMADNRTQVFQIVALSIIFGLFGGLGTLLMRKWEDQVLNPGSPQLWVLLGLATAWCVASMVTLRKSDRFLLKCPHCKSHLGGLSSQVVVASGRCGSCGGKIIDGDLN